MKGYKNRFYLAGFILFVLVVGYFVFAMSRTHIEKRRAERFLSVLQNIRVGSTNRVAVLKMTAPFRNNVSEDVDGRGRKRLSFVFDNIWLARMKLAPYADFRGWVEFKDDVVIFKTARVLSDSGAVANVTEEKRGQGLENGDLEPNHVVRGLDKNFPNSPTRRILVNDDDTFPETMRRQDWVLNLDCLTRFSGCADARLMLPNASPTPLPEAR